MAETDFDPAALLSKPIDSFEAPKPTPVGSYVFNVNNREFDKSGQKKTPLVRFLVTPVEPLPDVDTTALAEFTASKPLNEVEMRLEFYITPDAVYRLTDFKNHCQVDGEGLTGQEAIDACLGKQFVGVVAHSQSKDGTKTYANITQTAALPS